MNADTPENPFKPEPQKPEKVLPVSFPPEKLTVEHVVKLTILDWIIFGVSLALLAYAAVQMWRLRKNP